MNPLTDRRLFPSGCRRILTWTIALVLAWVALAGAQTSVTLAPNSNDPNMWPATFNGAPDMGPYAWVDGPTQLQKDPQLANGVLAGQEGTTKLFVCRVKMSDGTHPGKFFNGMCNVGWGGVEKVHTSGYELLVNTRPQDAKFFPQTWVSPATAASATFTGGSVGTTQMRVCRAVYGNGTHGGKEWPDKPNDPNTWPATFDGVNAMGPYAWVDGPTALKNDPNLPNGVRSDGGGGWFKPVLARARQSDGGIHPGQYSDYFKKFSIGWGGKEVVLADGYEVLVNTQPQSAKFLTQTWTDVKSADASKTFKGGSVGSTQMRVCRSLHEGLFKVGKEWAGKCNLGWGGQEVPVDNYQVLTLGFDKAAWQAAGGPIFTSLACNIGYGGKEVAVAPYYEVLSLGFDKAAWQAAQGTQVIVTGLPAGTPTPTPDPSLFQTQSAPVGVGKILRNVFVMRATNSPDVCFGVAIPDYNLNAKPGVARSLVKEGMSLRSYNWGQTPPGGLPGCVTTLPGTWFVREDAGQAGWFRLKWFDTNLCLNAASNTEGASVQLATCNDSVNQKWSLNAQSALMAGFPLVDDQGVIKIVNPINVDLGLYLTFKDGNSVLSATSYMPLIIDQYPEWKYQEDMIGGGPK